MPVLHGWGKGMGFSESRKADSTVYIEPIPSPPSPSYPSSTKLLYMSIDSAPLPPKLKPPC
jgi:hypothetical protein